MSILFVCHSMGDTQSLTATARKIVVKTDEKILFLIIGQAAKTIFEKLPADDLLKQSKSVEVVYLSKIFNEEVMRSLENKGLDETERLKLKTEFLEKHNISKALIGTPSQLNAYIPFQIAEDIAKHIDPNCGFIFNDYFFKETKHAYWQTLEQKSDQEKDWRNRFTWLAPLSKAKEKIIHANSSVSVQVVGHPAIDTAAEQKPQPAEKIAADLKNFQITESQSLLFVSGTKDINDDQALLDELLKTLAQQKNQTLQIRIGIHPGNQDLNTYLSALSETIEKYSNVAHSVKMIIPDTFLTRISSELLKNPHFIRANITGDQAAAAAHGVASAVPSTLVNQTAIGGRPAYYHQEDKESYLPENRLYVGKKNLPLFFERVMAKNQQRPIGKQELELPEKEAAEIMALHFHI